MLSEKQLAANRANAKKSTGPKTQGGKRISSQNALTHGLFAKAVLLPGESLENFNSLHRAYNHALDRLHRLSDKRKNAEANPQVEENK